MRPLSRPGGQHLHDVTLFDVYSGTNVAAGMKSLAYALTFVDPEKTLVDDEINAAVAKIEQKLAENHHAEIR